MALAATGEPETARAVSAAAARELKLSGVNWAYSPVADVNSDARNPVIGTHLLSLPVRAGAKVDLVIGVRSFSDGELFGLSSDGVC
jgi:hypothetical protein